MVGVATAAGLGLLIGIWARPDLGRTKAAAPMRAVTASGGAHPATMGIIVNAVPPPPVVKPAGRLDVLPAGLTPAAPRRAPAPTETAPPPEPLPVRPRMVQVDTPPPISPPRIAAVEGPCAGVRGRAAQLVCADPDLAAADRDLQRAYRRALRSGVAPEDLRDEQQDWLAIREDAARHFPSAVASVYEQRIDELNRIADDGPG